MAVNLSPGAVVRMLNGEVTTEKEMMPVLQVTELKLVQSKREPMKERFRMLLSDGTYLQQGMLGTSQNDLVKRGILQAGSVVKLTRFVCNLIQGRRIVIVIELEIVVEKYSIIGNPVQAGKPNDPGHASTDQRGGVTGDKPHIGGFEQQARGNELSGSRQINVPDSGRYAAAGSPQVGQNPSFATGSGYPGFEQQARGNELRSNPTAGYGSSRHEQSWPPPTAQSRPVRPVYPPQPPPPMYNNRGPVARNEAPPRIIPIAALNPYQGRWTIKVRVTSKSEFRHYSNPRGDGKVFSFDLLDADGGEIRVTCFNAVADQFFDQIVAGNVYLISRGSLRPAQKNFNHLPNDYEIILDNASTIQPCYEDDAAIPRQKFHFRSISDIESMENNNIVDVIGVVSSISPTASIMRKNGTETQKRALQLKDMSGRSVELTMWGNFCNAEGQNLQNLCDSGSFPVLAVKTGRISEFNGKAIGTIASSQLLINPDFPESRKLKEWFEREGRNMPSISISRESFSSGKPDVRKTISQIKDEKLGTSEKPDWITVNATIIYMKADNFCYTACPIMNGDRPCSKKVTNNGDGTWRCDKCDQCVAECDYRYILQLQIQDHTGLTWVTAFQEAGEEIMGISAKDLYYVKHEHQDDEKFAEVIRKMAFKKYNFKLKIKEETFSDEQRIRATVVKAEKVNYTSDTRFLLEAMDKLRTEEANSNYSSSEAFNGGTTCTRGETGMDGRQVGQYEKEYGGSGHVSAHCPSVVSEPAGQYNRGGGGGYSSGGISSGEGTYGGGPPRQHVGGY
ncbi:PREDICTED: replication protein A 70 kDa DNA-binding subunit E-like isoform X1 [Tarenaya hassleriana]|uniref:replication protein A 70 kDa DNA-binding subunit E-like isoform X1 n=1 Tax=Tarenaya hassleriana TaxID=28532 RepID=UPI00053C7F69|nr:PREDICTED: replication protein A 70 kDa DNA-binding subunit E-like isoform X1 [Tarenaya hassleriana]